MLGKVLAAVLARVYDASPADCGFWLAARLPGRGYLANMLTRRGNVLRDSMRAEDALTCYDRALRLTPDNVQAHYNRGNALLALNRPDDALASYDRALRLKPDYADAHYNRGVALQHLGRSADAVASYDRALSFRPGDAEAFYNRGHALADLTRLDAAIASYQQALSINPDYPQARWSLVMARIPYIAGRSESIDPAREAFSRGLAELETYFDSRPIDGRDIVGTVTPFYLAYQEKNNRELLARYGKLCARLMQRWQEKQAPPVRSNVVAGGAIRVGIVSAFVHSHSVWNAIVKGWLRHLDRNSFEFHVFSLGFERDDETERAKSSSSSFACGRKSLRGWVETIAGKQVDILIYPEIGIDPMTVKLASLRLAPVQVAAWGHPETSGLPTMYYYLSAEAFEPPEPQANYTEKLVALPHLGSCYAPLPVNSVEPDLARLGIRPDTAIFLCAGAPFKYAPQYDFVFVEIARRLGRCQFVFFTCKNRALSETLRSRLEAHFKASNLNFSDYGVFVPWQPKPEFYGLMKCADVFLDTIGFSGFNTAMQAVECNLPIVAEDGKFMRGRLASGILRRMGMHELIAATTEDYVRLAVILAADAGYRKQIRQRMTDAQDVLFEDVSSVHALGKILIDMAESGQKKSARAIRQSS